MSRLIEEFEEDVCHLKKWACGTEAARLGYSREEAYGCLRALGTQDFKKFDLKCDNCPWNE